MKKALSEEGGDAFVYIGMYIMDDIRSYIYLGIIL